MYKKIASTIVLSTLIGNTMYTPILAASAELPSTTDFASVQQYDAILDIVDMYKKANAEHLNNENRESAEKDFYKNMADTAKTPRETVEAFSLLNINPYGNASNVTIDKSHAVTPYSDFEKKETASMQPSDNVPELDLPINEDSLDGLTDLIALENEAIIDEETKKKKAYSIYAEHNIRYVDQHGYGNVPLDTSVTDDNGHYYQPSVTNQYQLEESFDMGISFKAFRLIDLTLGLVAKNEDGLLGKKGTKWEFGNVLFRFNPEKKIANKTGVTISDNGKKASANIGHESSIGGSSDGDVGISVGGLSYRNGQGFGFSRGEGKYYLGIGKMSINFSTYTLRMSDCKAIELGYIDDNEKLVFVYANPVDKQEGETKIVNGNEVNNPGVFKRIIKAVQYETNKLIKNAKVAFNFATAKDVGTLNNPNGTTPSETTVYSVAFQGNTPSTSYQGEIARSRYNADINSEGKQYSGNADYVDITHRFSDRLSGSLHAINIDNTFNANSLVEDKLGDYLLTTNTGDGKADYLYEVGQKGFDLNLNYRFPENASIAFGWSKYSLTKSNNSKNNYYLSGTKQWLLTNDEGENVGTFSIQQRFESDAVSNVDYTRKVSDTTVSADLEPWKDAELSTNLQRIVDNAEGNQSRFDLTLAQNFYPINRVTITPKIEYKKKKGEKGLDPQSSPIDSAELVTSLTLGYELVPDELTVNLLVAKERHDINESEIDLSTGAKKDGEKRDLTGVGLGLAWEPKSIPGLSASVSYRRDKVHYYTPEEDDSKQNVWDYRLAYSRPLSQNIRASISYDYRAARDKLKPIYDEITRTVSVDIDATISDKTTIRLNHSYSSEYKPLDVKNNYKTRTTTLTMRNKF